MTITSRCFSISKTEGKKNLQRRIEWRENESWTRPGEGSTSALGWIERSRKGRGRESKKCGNSDSGASVFHKGPRVHSLNGPPRAHCAHCRGSCLAHKHASRPESADEWAKPGRFHKRTLDNRATMKRGPLLLILRPTSSLENVSPLLLHLGGNSCRSTQRWMGNACWSMDIARITGFIAVFLSKVVSRPLKNGKRPLSARGFPVVELDRRRTRLRVGLNPLGQTNRWIVFLYIYPA